MKYLPIFIVALSLVIIATAYGVFSQLSTSITYAKSETVVVHEKAVSNIIPDTAQTETIIDRVEPVVETIHTESESFTVPFYSQFTDITQTEWRKIGCGIASLAMIIDFYETNPPTVDTLLQEGIEADAYLDDAGWTYAGLIGVSKKYGFTGQSYDLAYASMDNAFDLLQSALKNGPVMVSVHYKFEPDNPIPHLVIASGVHDGMIYYNDPAANKGNLSIPVSTFKDAWKKRYIEIRPIS